MDLPSKKILITGGTDGIGREAALQLVALGHEVTISGRSQEKADSVIEEAIQKYQKKIRFEKTDLSSLVQTQSFAEKVAKERYDIYIMNAGVMNPETSVTEDGLDMTLMTNFLSTRMIVTEVMKMRKDDRKIHFVFVTSLLMRLYNIPLLTKFFNPRHIEAWEKACQPTDKSGAGSYTVSKVGQAAMAELIQRQNIPGITATSVHPGCVLTNILRTLPARQRFYLKLCTPFITNRVVAGTNIVKAALCPLPSSMYYLANSTRKLPTVLTSDKCLTAISTFCDKFTASVKLQESH